MSSTERSGLYSASPSMSMSMGSGLGLGSRAAREEGGNSVPPEYQVVSRPRPGTGAGAGGQRRNSARNNHFEANNSPPGHNKPSPSTSTSNSTTLLQGITTGSTSRPNTAAIPLPLTIPLMSRATLAAYNNTGGREEGEISDDEDGAGEGEGSEKSVVVVVAPVPAGRSAPAQAQTQKTTVLVAAGKKIKSPVAVTKKVSPTKKQAKAAAKAAASAQAASGQGPGPGPGPGPNTQSLSLKHQRGGAVAARGGRGRGGARGGAIGGGGRFQYRDRDALPAPQTQPPLQPQSYPPPHLQGQQPYLSAEVIIIPDSPPAPARSDRFGNYRQEQQPLSQADLFSRSRQPTYGQNSSFTPETSSRSRPRDETAGLPYEEDCAVPVPYYAQPQERRFGGALVVDDVGQEGVDRVAHPQAQYTSRSRSRSRSPSPSPSPWSREREEREHGSSSPTKVESTECKCADVALFWVGVDAREQRSRWRGRWKRAMRWGGCRRGGGRKSRRGGGRRCVRRFPYSFRLGGVQSS